MRNFGFLECYTKICFDVKLLDFSTVICSHVFRLPDYKYSRFLVRIEVSWAHFTLPNNLSTKSTYTDSPDKTVNLHFLVCFMKAIQNNIYNQTQKEKKN